MLIKINTLKETETGLATNETIYAQQLDDTTNVFSTLIDLCNQLDVGESHEIQLSCKGRVFAFRAKDLDVRTIALAANGVRTRKAKAAAPKAEDTVAPAIESAPATV